MSEPNDVTGMPGEGPPPAAPVPPAAAPPGPPLAPEQPEAPRPRGHAAVNWGVALIVIGGLLLVNQFVPGFGVWRFWPLIIVALGVRQLFRRTARGWDAKEAADGLVTIGFGLVLQAQMLGVIGWNVWLNLLRLWPLLLVVIGVDLIGKGIRATWLRVLSSLLVLAGLAYGVLVLTPTTGWPPMLWTGGEVESFDFEAEHEAGIRSGEATIEAGVGTLDVLAGDELVTARGRSPFAPEFDVRTTDSSAEVRVGTGSGVWIPSGGDAGLEVALDRDVEWDLTIETGVSSYDADLRDLALTGLSVQAGVSRGIVTLGEAGAAGLRTGVPAKIEIGVSSITIKVPEGESVRVSASTGLTDVSMRGGWDRSDDGDTRVWESDGFSGRGAYWDIELTAGIGSVTVEYY